MFFDRERNTSLPKGCNIRERSMNLKKHGLTILLAAIFIIGLSLLLYPTVSDYWNSFHQSTAIASYMDKVSDLGDDRYKAIWDEAFRYNKAIEERGILKPLNAEQKKEYNRQLNISDLGILGYIEIPAISCRLPIYRGTDNSVLQIAIGHLEDTSLPVGGAGTHCILSGHRGLPSAKLFTDLDKLSEGDIFMLQIMDETLTYQVEKIMIVKPYEIEELKIEPGRDLCTLVTCTPYGINTHRLIVKGVRIETAEQPAAVRVPADASQIEPILVAIAIAAFFISLLWILLLISTAGRKKDKKE